MANKKQKPGPKPKDLRYQSIGIEIELHEAAERYSAKCPFHPTVSAIVNVALRRFLEADGDLPKKE